MRLDAALGDDLDPPHASPSAMGSASTDSNVLMKRAAVAPSSAPVVDRQGQVDDLARPESSSRLQRGSRARAADGQRQHVGPRDDGRETVD